MPGQGMARVPAGTLGGGEGEARSRVGKIVASRCEMPQEKLSRRPGRPRVIPDRLIPKVMALYRGGLGYRAIARELAKEGLSPDWSTVRGYIKRELGRGQITPG